MFQNQCSLRSSAERLLLCASVLPKLPVATCDRRHRRHRRQGLCKTPGGTGTGIICPAALVANARDTGRSTRGAVTACERVFPDSVHACGSRLRCHTAALCDACGEGAVIMQRMGTYGGRSTPMALQRTPSTFSTPVPTVRSAAKTRLTRWTPVDAGVACSQLSDFVLRAISNAGFSRYLEDILTTAHHRSPSQNLSKLHSVPRWSTPEPAACPQAHTAAVNCKRPATALV